MTQDLSLLLDNRYKISGWNNVRVTTGLERCPNDFSIDMTEFPLMDRQLLIAQPGQSCQIMIGAATVITGYIDRVQRGFSSGGQRVRLSGRGKCQDLVDCSAKWPSNQISGASALAIAQKLAAPYGITAVARDGDVGKAIKQMNIMWGETGFEVIERICRYSGLLAYEGADGNLILARVGGKEAGSGFVEGKNIEDAEILYSHDQRYREYIIRRLSMDPLQEAGSGGDIVATINDNGITRFRNLFIIAETGDGSGNDIARIRGAWECARRFGRSAALSLTTDSWCDGKGNPWEVNTLVPLHLPSLGIKNKKWCLSEVSFQRDENGTKAGLIFMPSEAFLPDPKPIFPNILQELSVHEQ